LSLKDLDCLAGALEMANDEFIKLYCRWISKGGGVECLSLREKSNFDCVFWKDGCSVYRSRPLQCRAFPFWPSIVRSSGAWNASAADCPGMGRGKLHSADIINAWLEQQRVEPVIINRKTNPKGED
jgi:Fe-S-cluster containining protein